jgi:glycogen operon protein
MPELTPRVTRQGTLFRAYSTAGRLTLLLYDAPEDHRPARIVELDPARHRQSNLWEVLVEDAGDGQLYAWAVDRGRPLVDPYALLLRGPAAYAQGPRPPLAKANRDARFKSVVVDAEPAPAWHRPQRAWKDSVVYELHVRGFTRAEGGGTFLALGEKAAYLRDLGVTAVELLPCTEFDETEVRRGDGLVNFWGYSPFSWIAPNGRYAAEPRRVLEEFRAMVRAFHAAEIEVILDVVFNHTGELDEHGPTWHFKDLAPDTYYLPANLTGCGNTVRCQSLPARALIRDALRWWTHEMGVDGFRFDLAAILARGDDGAFLEDPPLLREIEADPRLAHVRLIAEPWDAAGGHLVRDWPGNERWSVWNDRFRDDVRRAWLGHPELAPVLATRLCGSGDLFPRPTRGVNFVTAHDGFTLADVVSYSRRHNAANGERGRDGHAHEISASFGVEGPTGDPAIRARRDRARRNLVATLLLAQGVPMLLAGDEIGRTQKGNNNAYCHDGPLTWVDWTGLERDREFHAFVRTMIHLRREHGALRRDTLLHPDETTWIGTDGEPVDWETTPGAFGYRIPGDLLILVNLFAEPRTFRLPPDRPWHRLIDTCGTAAAFDSEYPLNGPALACLGPKPFGLCQP